MESTQSKPPYEQGTLSPSPLVKIPKPLLFGPLNSTDASYKVYFFHWSNWLNRVQQKKLKVEEGMTVSEFKKNMQNLDTDDEFITLHQICWQKEH